MTAQAAQTDPASAHLEAAAEAYLIHKNMMAQAQAALAKAKETFIATAKAYGVEEVETDEGTVYWYPASKRTAKNDEARDLLTGRQLDAITVPAVVLSKLDAAIELGIITKQEAAAIVKSTPYEAVKVR